jgi:cyclopropane-fatty-acyl-phospholipid synthase
MTAVTTAPRAAPNRVSVANAPSRRAFEQWLHRADAQLDGARAWDLTIHDERTFARILQHGSMGAGESYMDGWWDCDRLDEMLFRVLRARLDLDIPTLPSGLRRWLGRIRNPQSQRRAFEVGREHYDIGDDLYRAMLGPRMIYSCAYWRDANSLDEAQERKLDLVCRKLGLERGMRVLDIGCGWGGAAEYAAKRYGVSVVGITISKHQADAAQERCRGLPVAIRLQDYRSLVKSERRPFDRIYSLGMFEHVGERNYRTYFAAARRLLADDGLMLLHTIGSNKSVTSTDAWVERYIFPNSMLPSAAQVARACEEHWVVEDWHSFGTHYDRTLLAWRDNVAAAWPALGAQYGERFRRMWHFYLSSSAAAFRARRNQLWQIVLSPHGVIGGYTALR